MPRSFIKNIKERRECFVLLKRTEKNARTCVLLKITDAQPCLPPTPSPSGSLPTTPIPYPYTYWGGLWVSQRVWGGEGEQSSSISRFLGNSGALSALKQIVHKLSSLERLFHSVIYNSVMNIHFLIFQEFRTPRCSVVEPVQF